MLHKSTKPILGTCVAPYIWGGGAGAWQPGLGASKYGYPEPYENAKLYPRLIEDHHFVGGGWHSQDFQEHIKTQLKVLKWVGVDAVKYPSPPADLDDFTAWYLNEASSLGFSVFLEVEGLERFSSLSRLLGENAHAWIVRLEPGEISDDPERVRDVLSNASLSGARFGFPFRSDAGREPEKLSDYLEQAYKLAEMDIPYHFIGIELFTVFGSGHKQVHRELDWIDRNLPQKGVVFSDLSWSNTDYAFNSRYDHGNFRWQQNVDDWSRVADSILLRSMDLGRPEAVLMGNLQSKPIFRFDGFSSLLSSSLRPTAMARKLKEMCQRYSARSSPRRWVAVRISDVTARSSEEVFVASITNTSESDYSGHMMFDVPSLFREQLMYPVKAFGIKAGQTLTYRFPVAMPDNLPKGNYPFFLRVDFEGFPGSDGVYGFAELSIISDYIEIDEHGSKQTPEGIHVRYENLDKLPEMAFISHDGLSPAIVYGKDYGKGGNQMQVACGCYLMDSMIFSRDAELLSEEFANDLVLEQRPSILVGINNSNQWINFLQQKKRISKSEELEENTCSIEVVPESFGRYGTVVIRATDGLPLMWGVHDFLERVYRKLPWPLKVFPPSSI